MVGVASMKEVTNDVALSEKEALMLWDDRC